MSDGSRSSAQARQLIDMLSGTGTLEGLAELIGEPNKIPMFTGPGTFTLVPRTELVSGIDYDVQINTLADRDDYDAQLEGFVVLVSDVGDGRSAIYSRVGPPAGWTDPAYITGATGDAGPFTEITFGPVTTVSSSTPASADVVQVDEDTIRVDLSIPKGEDGSGTGDVVGPASATDGHVVVFDGTTGKLIKSAGKAPFSGSYTDLSDKPTLGDLSAIDLPAEPEGKLLDDSGTWVEPSGGGSVDDLFDGPLEKSPGEKAQARENIGLPPPDPGEMAAGTETEPRAISSADVRQGVAALAIGVGQTWQDMTASRSIGTTYQNTTGRPIQVVMVTNYSGGNPQVSPDGTTWMNVGVGGSQESIQTYVIVPNGWRYRLNGAANIAHWMELR